MSTHAERSASARKAARTRKRNAAKRLPNPRGVPKDADSLYRVRRERLDSGGSTRQGTYFGRDSSGLLFIVTTPDGDEFPVRAMDRADAMANFRKEYRRVGGLSTPHGSARFFGEKRVANPSNRKRVANPDEFAAVSLDGNMSPATQVKLRRFVKERAPLAYRIEAHGNSEDAKVLRRRKVVASGSGEYGKNKYAIARTRLPGLLIAMIRSGRDDEYSLASGILSTLNIEVL
jgi:hypothetical protein